MLPDRRGPGPPRARGTTAPRLRAIVSEPPRGRVRPAATSSRRSPPLNAPDARQKWKRRTTRTTGRTPGPMRERPAQPAGVAPGRISPASTAAGTTAPSPSTTSAVSAPALLLQALRRGTPNGGGQCGTDEGGRCAWPAPARAGSCQRPAELIDMSVGQPLTPAQSAKVRAYVFGMLRAQIPCAHRVVMGELEWSPTQARVFATLLDKCLPTCRPASWRMSADGVSSVSCRGGTSKRWQPVSTCGRRKIIADTGASRRRSALRVKVGVGVSWAADAGRQRLQNDRETCPQEGPSGVHKPGAPVTVLAPDRVEAIPECQHCLDQRRPPRRKA